MVCVCVLPELRLYLPYQAAGKTSLYFSDSDDSDDSDAFLPPHNLAANTTHHNYTVLITNSDIHGLWYPALLLIQTS